MIGPVVREGRRDGMELSRDGALQRSISSTGEVRIPTGESMTEGSRWLVSFDGKAGNEFTRMRGEGWSIFK
eukprot:7091947-Pyramimonas_sp.AAC.1